LEERKKKAKNMGQWQVEARRGRRGLLPGPQTQTEKKKGAGNPEDAPAPGTDGREKSPSRSSNLTKNLAGIKSGKGST